MNQKRRDLQTLFEPFIDEIVKRLPENGSKDITILKLQEAVWWADKSYVDEDLAKEAGDAVKTN